MKPVLERLVSTPGIRAAAVFDQEGTCLAAEGDAETTKALLAAAPQLLAPATGEDSFLGRQRVAIARYARGTLMLRRSPSATLVVVCEPAVDLGIADVGFHVAVAFKVLSIRAASRRPPRASGAVPAPGAEDDVPAAIPALKLPKM